MRLRGIYPPPRRKGRLDDDCILEICCYILDDGPPADETSAYATSYGLAYSMDAPPSKWRVRQENHRDVLAFGLTCKQFANSALDVLWSEIDGLVRLLNVLPSSNFHKVSDGKYVRWVQSHTRDRPSYSFFQVLQRSKPAILGPTRFIRPQGTQNRFQQLHSRPDDLCADSEVT
jgi:hypothetical protein